MRAIITVSLVFLAGHLGGCREDDSPASSEDDNPASSAAPSAIDGGSATNAAPTRVDPVVSDDDRVEPPTPSRAAVSYASVAPIFSRACVQCHSAGQIGPFSLETYEKAKPFAPIIAKAARARTMPPSVIDASGACNKFPDVPWLSEDEIRTLEQWADAGAPAAPDGALPAAIERPPLPTLKGEVYTLRTASYTPSKKSNDDYRCFVVDSPFEEDTFVTGIDMQPANAATAHHMVLFYPIDDLSAAVAVVNDALEDGPGYTCFGASGTLATVIAAWTPGAGVTNFPANLGIKVHARRPLIVQMHYNTSAVAEPGPEVTELTLGTNRDAIPAKLIPLLGFDMTIPAGQASVDYVAEHTLASKLGRSGPVEVYGVYPHMHELGRSIKVTWAGPPDANTCIVDAPRYSFHWQRMYFFDQPQVVDADSTISVRCTFDTSSRSGEPIKWGEGTADEMCVSGVFVKL